MADTIEIVQGTATVVEVAGPTGPQGPAGATGATGATGPAGPAGTGIQTLTTKGDLLSRDDNGAIRVGIGSTGQILKVSAQGLPTWANESGAVTSVNGQTGAVLVAAEQHASEHEAGEADEIQATAALVDTDYLPLNGVYFHDGTFTSGRPNFFKTGTRKNTKIVYNSGTGQWNLVRNNVVEAVGVDGPSAVPWGNTWEEFATPEFVTVTRLPLETMVQRLAETGGTAPATTSEDGLMSSADKTKLNGIASGAEVNVQANWTEADTASDAFIQNKPATFAPTAHAASHASAGSDPLFDQDLNTTDDVAFNSINSAVIQGADLVVDSSFEFKDLANSFSAFLTAQDKLSANRNIDLPNGDGTIALVSDIPALGAGAGEAAEGNHVHGNLTSDGKLGSTAGLPVVTTTAGAVTTLALGTANQVLRVNSGATAVEFADPAASGVTGAAASASDVLGVSGANITGVDANADRMVFWDDSASKLTYLEAGSGLSISGTTLTASGGLNAMQSIAINFVLN